LLYAAEVAHRLGGELTVLHVWECMPHAPPDLKVKTPGGKTKKLAEVIRDNAEADMKEFVASAALPAKLSTRTLVESGEAAKRILELAASGAYDLLVMGTHGRGGVKHLVLGSVAAKVVRGSPIPVITLRAQAENES
jgi:nucleotide-binding universal stress UspA family protein